MYRLLIAEDEPLIRKGVCSALDWESLGFCVCGTAESGIEALEIMAREPVDVLLTDIKMPGMTGLEAVRELRRLHPGVEVVVLSGYADFAYMREALTQHVFDYVLKMDVLTELEPVMRRLKQRMDAQRALKESESLRALFEGLDPSRLKEHAGPSRLMLVECPPGSRHMLAGRRFVQVEEGVCAVLLKAANMEGLDEETEGFLRQLSMPAIIGAPYFRREEAVQACCELAKARDYLARHPGKHSGRVRTEELRYPAGEIGVSVQAQRLSQLLSDGTLEERLAGLSAMIGHFIDVEGATVVHARLSVIHALSRMACADPNGVGTLYAATLPQLNRAVSMRALERAAADFLTRADALTDGESHDTGVIARAIRYINRNFYKNLRQEAVAARFYLSPSYFSRCFKQEAGMGFTEYVRKLRMEWAKHLLQETDMLIQDVARECGYNDIKHFNQTFRAYYGMSASRMRSGGD